MILAPHHLQLPVTRTVVDLLTEPTDAYAKKLWRAVGSAPQLWRLKADNHKRGDFIVPIPMVGAASISPSYPPYSGRDPCWQVQSESFPVVSLPLSVRLSDRAAHRPLLYGAS